MLWIVLGVAAIVIFAGIGTYNGLVAMRNRFKNAFAQIDVQLKRRYDLIPNLVETAKGYMKHEHDTLEAVVKARQQAVTAADDVRSNPTNPEAMQNLIGAESSLRGSMGRLMVVLERYPELKANENMKLVMEELTSTENKVSFARQAYNDAATVYNTKRETFPSNIIAGMFGFLEAKLFEITEQAERETVKVKFT